MLWIEEIVESTAIPPFLNNFKVGMVSFMNINKLFAKNEFLTFPSAQNGVELEGGEKVKANLNLQKSLNQFPSQTKKKLKQI